jgi:membrane associated rhomboid family serine protease
VTVAPWLPHEEGHQEAGPLGALRRELRPGDAVAIASVPAFLVAIFAFVGSPEPPLVLSHSEPAATALLTAHFVHRSLSHLLDNLIAYSLVVPTAYALASLGGRRREFLIAFVGNLFLLPPVLSGLGLLVLDRGVTLGFSGVTMAFVGLVALQSGTYLEERLTAFGDDDPAAALFFAGLALVALRTVASLGPRLVLASGAMAIAGFAVRGSLGSVLPVRRSLSGLRSDAGQLGALGVFVLGVGLLSGFPEGAGSGPVVVNTFGHFAGFVLGFVAPYLAFRVPGRHRALLDLLPGAV